MIPVSLLEEVMYESMRRAAVYMPSDVTLFLQKALEKEHEPLAHEHLAATLRNADMAGKGKGLICADTGFPLYFITADQHTEIEGGFSSLWKAARSAVIRATEENFLRPTMVDPISRKNPGNNLGKAIPAIDLSFIDTDMHTGSLEIIAAPKGGGSEIFGTFYRMMYPADGREGILKFIYDSVIESCYAGKVCPPAIVGVGIGGTADICMHMAKKAAVLRPIGSRNTDKDTADMEMLLEKAFLDADIGPMGAKGTYAVMGVHIEKEVTHTAALPVAVNAQCCIGRRWKATVRDDLKVTYSGDFYE